MFTTQSKASLLTQQVNFYSVKWAFQSSDNNNGGNIKHDQTDCESFNVIKKLKSCYAKNAPSIGFCCCCCCCFLFFFLSGFSFYEHSRITGLQGKGEGISSTPHYHFHPLQKQLDINQAITAESPPLHIGSSRTQTVNLCFSSASC